MLTDRRLGTILTHLGEREGRLPLGRVLSHELLGHDRLAGNQSRPSGSAGFPVGTLRGCVHGLSQATDRLGAGTGHAFAGHGGGVDLRDAPLVVDPHADHDHVRRCPGQGAAECAAQVVAVLGLGHRVGGAVGVTGDFRKLTIDVFLDIQNLTNSRSTGSLSYTFERNADNTDFATTDGEPIKYDGSNAIPIILKDDDGTILPTVGFIVEF